MEKLNPTKCPFCGKETVTVNRSGPICFVRCESCKAEGPSVNIEEICNINSLSLETWMSEVKRAKLIAVEKWNNRASSPEKTDTEKAYDNLCFSFKALASAAGNLAEENEKLEKILDELKSCGSCKFLDYPFSKDPCKVCIENEGLSKWEYNEE